MFNLIVGTGALTMPKAFATAGWAVSLSLITFLGFMSYMTTTFVIEAMAAANAQLRWKRREQEEVDDHSDSTSECSDDDIMVRGRSKPECRPILSVQRSNAHVDPFDIVERVEMGQMASMFFNKVGMNMFYICIIVYLYGDLAIYAAAVPISLMEVACGNHNCSAGPVKYNDTDPCWGPVTRNDAYRVFLSVFTLLLGPFTFFNAQKTKYLQILTSLMRWIVAESQGTPPPLHYSLALSSPLPTSSISYLRPSIMAAVALHVSVRQSLPIPQADAGDSPSKP
ncbi:hypothetical protein NHX12_032327 [Muraenolepis orangiensis]|uniref:Amino acid transporter transmembrane domain-containing protein n=1 Tax=Muraenolepis orangiensis TaxID=630683 RepID=A0A9Q0E6Y2_9TELE|nr:hypothetical protein NHX12_032327 [Muraenolepis orangiensis]